MHRWVLLPLLAACGGGPEAPAPSPDDAAQAQQAAQQAVQQASDAARSAQAVAVPPAPPAPPAVPAPVDAAAAAVDASSGGRWRPLYPKQARATSFLKSNWNKYTENYHPNYAFDDNPRTAWVEGAEGNGEGEVLFIPLSSLSSVRRVKLRIRNGYQKSEELLQANAAPREIFVRLVHDYDDSATGTFELRRELGWQEVVLAVPEGKGLDQVVLEIRSVHPGSKYQDTCISDIEVLVDSDVRYSVGQERAHRKELLAWVSERVATAKYFASQAEGYPFVATQFEADSEDTSSAALKAAMREGRGLLAQMRRRTDGYKLTADHQIPSAPDGLYVVDGLLPYFTPKELHFHPSDEELAAHEKKGDDGDGYEMWSMEVWRSNVRVEWTDKPGRNEPFRTVYFWEKTIEQGRGTYEYKTEYVVRYGEDGSLAWIYSVRTGTGEVGQEEVEELITFKRQGRKLMPETRQFLTQFKDSPEAQDYASITRYRS